MVLLMITIITGCLYPTNEWEDQNKVKRRTTEIRCDNFTMLGRRSDSPQGTTAQTNKAEDQDDDLPF